MYSMASLLCQTLLDNDSNVHRSITLRLALGWFGYVAIYEPSLTLRLFPGDDLQSAAYSNAGLVPDLLGEKA